jgi:hypothetical protein
MPTEQVNHRLVLEVGDSQAVSQPGPLDQVLEAFSRQVTTGAFRPGSGRRLLVLSNEAWSLRRSVESPRSFGS